MTPSIMSPSPQNSINVVVEHLEAGLIEVLRQPALGDRHADAHSAALTQGPGRRLDARGTMIFRVARTFAVQLPEALDVVESDCEFAGVAMLGIGLFDAGEMQHRIEQHRGVSVGQHEAVAVRPRSDRPDQSEESAATTCR